MRRFGALLVLALASTALAADAVKARFRWEPGTAFEVEVVLERLVRHRGEVVQAHKTLGAYELSATAVADGLRLDATRARIVAEQVRDASPLEALALGAWAPFVVGKDGAYVGLASANAGADIPGIDVDAGARRQWDDLVASWNQRRLAGGDLGSTGAYAEQVTLDVACGDARCVTVERTSSRVLERDEIGADGVLGWSDRIVATFEPKGLVPHEVATERAVALRVEGVDGAVERVDRATRRYQRIR